MNKKIPTLVFDVSKGLGFGILYQPIIGKVAAEHFPLAIRFPVKFRHPRKKDL